MVCPGFAATVGALMGTDVALTKFCKMPGPSPALLALKIPNALLTILTGKGLLREPFAVTRRDAVPRGAFDGMMALICPLLTRLRLL
jgi:hypothetical protein